MNEIARFDTPVLGPEMALDAGWIDYNDHLNMAYYNVIFDRTVDIAMDILNCGLAYRMAENHTMMTAQAHVTYIRELKSDARVRGTFRLLDADDKRLHVYLELFHADGWLAAASENMMLHVDLSGPRVARFPESISADVQTMLKYHRSLPPTKYMGRAIAINGR
jgi:acyl-CoA thioester hydrolase